MTPPLEIPELRKALAEVSALQVQVADLLKRQDETERALQLRVPAPDDVISLARAAAAIGKSHGTLVKWTKNARLFERYNLRLLLEKDVTGHWVSSPRLVARWKQVMFRTLAAEALPTRRRA